jgi:hypothetical protein
MKKLINDNPKRFFAFGCSFTEYKWATWANILAYEFGCEFYNFGKSGAGNTYIANQVTQANNYFNFDENDLVIICWTNISREDRYIEKNGWVTPGNIYSQQDYDRKFVKNWANDTHFALRDFAYIDLIDTYLQGRTNYHFLSMCNIVDCVNQWENNITHNASSVIDLSKVYGKSLSKITASFYDTLWNGNMDNKWQKDWQNVHHKYSDGHPTILEHYQFLTKVFDYQFSHETVCAVKDLHNDWVSYIRDGYKHAKHDCGLHDMPKKWVDEIYNNFRLKEEKPIPPEIFH